LVIISASASEAGLFPKWLGQLLIFGAACYIVDLLAAFLVPDFGRTIHGFIVVTCAVAEISMVVYLLVVGVKTSKRQERVLAAA
jgi:hypothetical protein